MIGWQQGKREEFRVRFSRARVLRSEAKEYLFKVKTGLPEGRGFDFQGRIYKSGEANSARKTESKWPHLFGLVFEQSKREAKPISAAVFNPPI